ncbi:unnamed protein product [Caenorhabditis auriculariae]|uniref:Uncharacterized protein n=1 Tax=Caenorhabditis auriculariae TaxID=2777116 RepID=A0A8S1HHP5_9PELO|nr:unnamed protein product [Caenorhabditis auriculariae]
MGDVEMKDVKEEERHESPPLGPIDPSRITNVLADQSGFVVPGPPSQQWQRTPGMSPAIGTGIDATGSNTPGSQRSSTGTPNHPPLGPHSAQPMTPSGSGTPAGTPGSGGPAPFEYPPGSIPQHQIPPYPGPAGPMHLQQQASQSPGVYRPVMMMPGQPMMHQQYPPNYVQWQQQQQMQQAHFARQGGQRVMIAPGGQQRLPVPYPPGYPPGQMQAGGPPPGTPTNLPPGAPPPPFAAGPPQGAGGQQPPQRPTPGTPGGNAAQAGPGPSRPQYPAGVNGPPPAGYPYPGGAPPQPGPPPGQPPQFHAGPPQYPPQMYARPGQPQMRQYISPQAQAAMGPAGQGQFFFYWFFDSLNTGPWRWIDYN